MRLSGGKPFLFKRTWEKRQRFVLLSLIGANLVAFIVQVSLEAFQPGFVPDWLGLSNRAIHEACSWQFATAAFLHTGAWHLLADILILYFFGRDLESILGQRHLLALYFSGIVAGELTHLFLMPVDTVLYAASGGVAAVLVAYATVLPELELASIRFSAAPLRLKAKHLVFCAVSAGVVLLCLHREGIVVHSAWLGGCGAGWLYAHLLGFGQPSFFQRVLRRKRATAERDRRMPATQFIAEKIDPILEKISRDGIESLSRTERRLLSQAQQKVIETSQPE